MLRERILADAINMAKIFVAMVLAAQRNVLQEPIVEDATNMEKTIVVIKYAVPKSVLQELTLGDATSMVRIIAKKPATTATINGYVILLDLR